MTDKGPLPSGLYSIENKQYGSINHGFSPPLDEIHPLHTIPVVSAKPGAVWNITHVKGHTYKINLGLTLNLFPRIPTQTQEMNELLYLSGTALFGDQWFIFEYDGYFIITTNFNKAWMLEGDTPGTQVRVLPFFKHKHPQGSGAAESAELDESSLQILLDNQASSKDLQDAIEDSSLWKIRALHPRPPKATIPHEPKILWIGCSDARVPESVMGTQDQIFVHRNIANQFHLTDINAVSVLTYGVTGITNNPIKEIRVVGHSDCGGVQAAHDAVNGIPGQAPGSALAAWLAPLRALAEKYKDRPSIDLARANVRVQVENVKETLKSLDLGRLTPLVNGSVYHIDTGEFEPVPSECLSVE